MSNIYLEVTIEKNWCFRNFDFLSLERSLQVSFCRAPAHTIITEFSNFLLQLENQRSGSKAMCGFLIIFKSKSPYFLLNENINFGKNKTESKMENLTHSFRETNLCFSLHKNHELKVKLWWVGARERKEMHFCNAYFVQRNFFLFAFVFYLYVICI